jgi:flagellar hook assembly protein FlgD
MGQRIRTLINSQRSSGSHTVVWDGRDNQGREVASGVYFYEIVSGAFSKSAKMLLVR